MRSTLAPAKPCAANSAAAAEINRPRDPSTSGSGVLRRAGTLLTNRLVNDTPAFVQQIAERRQGQSGIRAGFGAHRSAFVAGRSALGCSALGRRHSVFGLDRSALGARRPALGCSALGTRHSGFGDHCSAIRSHPPRVGRVFRPRRCRRPSPLSCRHPVNAVGLQLEIKPEPKREARLPQPSEASSLGHLRLLLARIRVSVGVARNAATSADTREGPPLLNDLHRSTARLAISTPFMRATVACTAMRARWNASRSRDIRRLPVPR
jgi:hypothetical protein